MPEMTVYLREDIAEAWGTEDPFKRAEAQEGSVYRAREGRRTLRFNIDSRAYFLKYHSGIGWKEIIKNFSQAKKPVLGAMTEVRAIRALQAAGLATMSIAAYGVRGWNPAKQESFIVTDELADTVSLEDLGEMWLRDSRALSARFKRDLIVRVAGIARVMHESGINHRDFYLAHFLMSRSCVESQAADSDIYLIDLHRTQVRNSVPRRWKVKDLGGLYFSTARYGLTRRDIFRFIKIYSALPLREALVRHAVIWRDAKQEGNKIYRRYYEKEPGFPLQFCEHPGKDI